MADRDANSPATVEDSLLGTLVAARYRVVRKLGEGGMGTVYQAVHEALRKPVALKVLSGRGSADKEMVARFEREAVAAANLRHPNIAEATDFGRLPDGSFYLVMEYVEGQTLRALLAATRGGLPPARALPILRQVAAALARAHHSEVVHRDLKPENIIVFDRPGEKDAVKVIDFGIARIRSATFGVPGTALTVAGAVFGTPEYMAPEQVLGQPADARADQYAFGVMAFEMLTGRAPYKGLEVTQILMKHVNAPIPSARESAPHLPQAVCAALETMLAKRPEGRFSTIEQAYQALEAAFSAPVSGAGTILMDPSTPWPASVSTGAASPRPPMASSPGPHMTAGPVAPTAGPVAPAPTHLPVPQVTVSAQSAATPPVPAVTGPIEMARTVFAAGKKSPVPLVAALSAFGLVVVVLLVWRLASSSSLPDPVDDALDKWSDGAYEEAEPALRDGIEKQPSIAADAALYEPLIATVHEDEARTVLLRLLDTTALGRSAPLLAVLADMGVEEPSARRNGALRLLRGRHDLLPGDKRPRIALRDADDCAALDRALKELPGAGSAAEADAKTYREGKCPRLLRRAELCGCPPPGPPKGRVKKGRGF